jgi:sn-1 stearoyl-lipid 9-desaturase
MDASSQSWTRGLLLEPTYGFGTSAPRKPVLREVGFEVMDAVAFWKNPSRSLAAAVAVYHLVALAVFLLFLARFFSISRLAIVLVMSTVIGMVYNTIWYHRYCSHRAFRFRSLWLARLFLWTNPLGFREESFVIPHRIHHSTSDQPGDPYGPHLGWLGSYLAGESNQKMNRDISAQDYERLSRSLEHIGFLRNSYSQFQRTGSVENVYHYVARTVLANLVWISAAYAIGRWQGVVMWVSAVFLFSFMLRDFNYRGHGGPFLSACKGAPINQIYYGLLAGEWHENHHAHPGLARSGLAWWQVDVPYWIIRALSLCGAVVHYNSLADDQAHQSLDLADST